MPDQSSVCLKAPSDKEPTWTHAKLFEWLTVLTVCIWLELLKLGGLLLFCVCATLRRPPLVKYLFPAKATILEFALEFMNVPLFFLLIF